MAKLVNKYNVGDIVYYVNDNGVYWGSKTIVQLADDHNPKSMCYHFTPTDTPWYPNIECNLFATEEEAQAAAKERRATWARE
jgi:hypothetical protein